MTPRCRSTFRILARCVVLFPFVLLSPLGTSAQSYTLLRNSALEAEAIRWRHFPVDVGVYPETSASLDESSAVELVSRAFDDWADEGCFDTSANVSMTPGTDWATGNGRNEVVWETGDPMNFDKYKPSFGNKQVGDACTRYDECATGFCDETCLQPGPNPEGSACVNPTDCATLFCFDSVCTDNTVILGITILIYPLFTAPHSIIEADIVLNETDEGLKFGDAADATKSYSVMAHEVGHFLGLAHYDEAGPEGALMHSRPQAPTIQDGDRMGLCAQYPAGEPLCDSDCDCFRGDGCAADPTIGNPGYMPSDPRIPFAQSCPRSELCIEGQCRQVVSAAEGEECAIGGVMTCADDTSCRGEVDTAMRCQGGTNPQTDALIDGPPSQARGLCSGSCERDNDCSGTGVCVDGRCDYPETGPDGSACSGSDDCESGTCTGGYCGRPCAQDCDCSALGTRCEKEKGVCVAGRSSCYRACVDPPECTEVADLLDRRFTGNACALRRAGGRRSGWLFGVLAAISLATWRRRRRRR